MTIVTVPEDELELTYVASSGPGGQHANKAATKVELRWAVLSSLSVPEDVRRRFVERYANRVSSDGVLVLRCQSYRSRHQNVQACIAKLQRMLNAVARPPRPRHSTRPTRSSVERRLENKRQRSEKKRRRRSPRIPPE